MNMKIAFLFAIVVLFQCCKNEQRVDLDRALDITISLESKQLTRGTPNHLTLRMENTSERVVKVPDSDLIIEFTSYSGSIKQVFPLHEISNGSADLNSLSNFNLKPKEERSAKIELGNLVYGTLVSSDVHLPADDYTINIFLPPVSSKQYMKLANNIRSNYVDLVIYD
jgi:hypothetical protein